MKKISFIALFAAVIGMTIMSSCSKGEEFAAPTITLNPSATSTELDFAAGDSVVSFSARIQAEGEISTFTITEMVTNVQGGTSQSAYDAATTDGFKGETDKTYDFSKTFSPTDFATNSKYEYRFDVTDKDGQTYSITYTVTQSTGTQAGDIDTYTVVLGSYNSTTGSSFASSNGTVYNWSDATANSQLIDFVYYYGATNNATIAAPDDADAGTVFDFSNWATKNATRFGVVTGVDFSAITDDTEIVSNESVATASAATGLSVGTVVEFKTASGKYGMFVVSAINGTTSSGTINITVKVQQ